MAQQPIASAPSRRFRLGTIGLWLMALVSIGLLLLLIMRVVLQFAVTPAPAHRFQLEQDVPLPGALPSLNPNSKNPLQPGLAARFDHFDFQAFDPKTHLLFIVHTGPNPDRQHLTDPTFNAEKDAATDGNVLVFDTVQKKLVQRLPIPQAAGTVVASDIGKVFVGDANDGIIYEVDEHTFQLTQIPVDPLDSPDAMDYDPVDHKVFVADPGAPADPTKTMAIDPKNQNVVMIDLDQNNKVTPILMPSDGKWGDDVGHVHYDPTSQRVYVVTLPLPNVDDPNAVVVPPSFLNVIDPRRNSPTENQVLNGERIKLPDACLNPHGMAIDSEQEIAFVACVDNNEVARVDLKTRMPFPDNHLPPIAFGPDIVSIDHPLHQLFIGCAKGISVFAISGRGLRWLGDFFINGNSHTLAINEQTQEVYVPLPSVGGRPVLRIEKYDPNASGT